MVVRLSYISSKMAWKDRKTFFACFWAYIRQPHSHIGWATINSTNPRTNPWNLYEKILRNEDSGTWWHFLTNAKHFDGSVFKFDFFEGGFEIKIKLVSNSANSVQQKPTKFRKKGLIVDSSNSIFFASNKHLYNENYINLSERAYKEKNQKFCFHCF